jgi:hypothetical protein
MARKNQHAGSPVDSKDPDVVGALIAHVKELASRIEIEGILTNW